MYLFFPSFLVLNIFEQAKKIEGPLNSYYSRLAARLLLSATFIHNTVQQSNS